MCESFIAGATESETRLVHRSQRRVNQGRFKRRHTSRRLPESGRNDDRNSVGTRYTRRDSDSRRSRHEAVAGGQSLDAPEASRKIPWNCRYRPRRFSGEQSRAGERERERCRAAHPSATRSSHRVRRADRAHFSTDAHASFGRSGASIGRWRRQARNSGASLLEMIFATLTCSWRF